MKLLTTIVLMTLSAFTFANETPKQFAPFSIVTKEVSDKLDIEYKSMVDSIIHITRKTEFAYTEADIRKAATVVAVEYSPCKYTQRIDVLECQSTRNDLISYLTASVMESPAFIKLEKVNDISESKLNEQEGLSLSERTKMILSKGKSNGNGKISFEDNEVKNAVRILSAILSDKVMSSLYEEMLLDDYNKDKTQQIEKRKEAVDQKTPTILKPIIFVIRLVESGMNLGLSDKRYSCSYDGTDVTFKCKFDYKSEFKETMLIIWLIALLAIALISGIVKEPKNRLEDK